MTGLYTPRVHFVAPEPAHRAALADAPPPWLADVFAPATRERRAAVWLVCQEVAGGVVVTRRPDGHHVDVYVVPRLRRLGIATEALARLAERLLVEENGDPLVGQAPDDAARRIAAKLGAVPVANGFALDLAAFTALERRPVLDGARVARIVASLRKDHRDNVRAHAQGRADAFAARQAAAKKAAAKTAAPKAPAAPLATDAEFEATLAACYDNITKDQLEQRIAARWYTQKQLGQIEDALDESRFPERERNPDRQALSSWVYAHRKARGD